MSAQLLIRQYYVLALLIKILISYYTVNWNMAYWLFVRYLEVGILLLLSLSLKSK